MDPIDRFVHETRPHPSDLQGVTAFVERIETNGFQDMAEALSAIQATIAQSVWKERFGKDAPTAHFGIMRRLVVIGGAALERYPDLSTRLPGLKEAFADIMRLFYGLDLLPRWFLDHLERLLSAGTMEQVVGRALADAGQLTRNIQALVSPVAAPGDISLVYSHLQERIMEVLDGKCLTADKLAEAVPIERSKLWQSKKGTGLTELERRGLVAKRPGRGGYFRPDSPPRSMVSQRRPRN